MKRILFVLSFMFFICSFSIVVLFPPLSPATNASTQTEIISIMNEDGTSTYREIEIDCQNTEEVTSSSYTFKKYATGDTNVNILLNYINYPDDTTNQFTQSEIDASVQKFRNNLGDYYSIMSQGYLTVNLDYIITTATESYQTYLDMPDAVYSIENGIFTTSLNNTTRQLSFDTYNVKVNVFAGSPGAWSTFLWPHAYTYQSLILLMETRQEVGTMCHELNHIMGVPDLYCYEEDSPSQTFGVYNWDIMGSSSNVKMTNAYFRQKMGWLEESSYTDATPTPIETIEKTTTNLTLYACQEQNKTKPIAYKFGEKDDEYFVAEFKIKETGAFMDSGIPKTAVAIYRVNKNTNGNSNSYSQTKTGLIFMGNLSYDIQTSTYINSCGLLAGESYGSTSTSGNFLLKYSGGIGKDNIFSGDNSGIVVTVKSLDTNLGYAVIDIVYNESQECSISTSVVGLGSISPANAILNIGQSQLFTITYPESIGSITIDGTPISSSTLQSVMQTGQFNYLANTTGNILITVSYIEGSIVTFNVDNYSVIESIYFTTSLDSLESPATKIKQSSFSALTYYFPQNATVYCYATLPMNTSQYSYSIKESSSQSYLTPSFANTYLIKTIIVGLNENVTVEASATREENKFSVTLVLGNHIQNAYISTSANATSGEASGTEYNYGTTVYVYVTLTANTAQFSYSYPGATLVENSTYRLNATMLTEDITLNLDQALQTTNKYAFNVNVGTNVKNVFLSTNENATSGDLVGTRYDYGTTVYCYATLPQNTPQFTYTYPGATLIEGYIYRVSSQLIDSEILISVDATRTTVSYKITWLNHDNSLLGEDMFEYGNMPIYSGQTPTKPNQTNCAFLFIGWSPALTKVTGEQTYIATFKSVEICTVKVSGNSYAQNTFISLNNNDSSGDSELEVPLGATLYLYATLPENDAQYRYYFPTYLSKINERLYLVSSVVATQSMTFTIEAMKAVQTYTISWLNYDGTLLLSELVEYGSTPVYKGTKPVKPNSLEYAYDFEKWSPELSLVEGDQTYTALFSSSQLFTIEISGNEYVENVFLSFADNALNGEATISTTAGKILYYYAVLPENSAQFMYTLENFQHKLNDRVYLIGSLTVEEDKELNILAIRTLLSYTVTWLNYDGSLLASQNFDYGIFPSYQGQTPQRNDSANYIYTFTGWTPSIVIVEGNQTYTALYSFIQLYDVNIMGDAYTNKVFFCETEGASEGQTSAKVQDGTTLYFYAQLLEDTMQYCYTLNGSYENKLSDNLYHISTIEVHENININISITRTLQVYTISWINYDGRLLLSENLAYGTLPAYMGTIPSKPQSTTHIYTFSGWTPAILQVTGEQNYIATFEATQTYFIQVNKLNYVEKVYLSLNENSTDGANTLNVPEGTIVYYFAILQENTAQYSFHPTKFVKSINENTYLIDSLVAKEDKTFNVDAIRETRFYTITWLDYDGSILDSQTLEYGSLPVFNGTTPYRQPTEHNTFTFNGWSRKISIVTDNQSYTAEYITTSIKEDVQQKNPLPIVAIGCGGAFFITALTILIWPKKKKFD